MTKKACVIGFPVKHSRSPLIHGFWLAQHGIAGRYDREEVAPPDFSGFMAGLSEAGYVGGNVTVPHKEAAFRLAQVEDRGCERIFMSDDGGDGDRHDRQYHDAVQKQACNERLCCMTIRRVGALRRPDDRF